MDAPLLEFSWTTPVNGFRWSAEFEFPQSALSESSPEVDVSDPVLLPQSAETHIYEPFRQHSGMFKQFAETEPSADGVLVFANRYGMLQSGEAAIDAMPTRAVPPWINRDEARLHLRGDLPSDRYFALRDQFTIKVERLRTWQSAIGNLSFAVRLWDFVRTNPTRDRLIEALDWSHPEGPVFPADPKIPKRVVVAPHCGKDQISTLFLQQALSNWINHVGRVALAARIAVPVTRHDRQRKIISPPSLLSAMWMQFLDAIDQGKEYRRCALDTCPRVWFEVSTDQYGARADAKYCSNACKQKAWRLARQRKTRSDKRKRG